MIIAPRGNELCISWAIFWLQRFFLKVWNCVFLRVKQNHREDGTKAACLVEEACLHSIGRGWGRCACFWRGGGDKGWSGGYLNSWYAHGRLRRNCIFCWKGKTAGYLFFILDVMRAVFRNIKYQFPENCLTAVRDVWGKRVCFACMFTSHGGFSELGYLCLKFWLTKGWKLFWTRDNMTEATKDILLLIKSRKIRKLDFCGPDRRYWTLDF